MRLKWFFHMFAYMCLFSQIRKRLQVWSDGVLKQIFVILAIFLHIFASLPHIKIYFSLKIVQK